MMPGGGVAPSSAFENAHPTPIRGPPAAAPFPNWQRLRRLTMIDSLIKSRPITAVHCLFAGITQHLHLHLRTSLSVASVNGDRAIIPLHHGQQRRLAICVARPALLHCCAAPSDLCDVPKSEVLRSPVEPWPPSRASRGASYSSSARCVTAVLVPFSKPWTTCFGNRHHLDLRIAIPCRAACGLVVRISLQE